MISGKTRKLVAAACAAAFVMILGSISQGEVILMDRNSEVRLDPNGSAGMYSWTVDGVEHLYKQWFWYRVGNAPSESSLDKLSLTYLNISNGNRDPNNERMVAVYSDPLGRFEVQVDYNLSGGAPGSSRSDMAETITFNSLTSMALTVKFFQYCDFDLGGTAGNDSVEITGGNTATQTDGTSWMSETVVTNKPTFVETSYFPTLQNSLNDANVTTLNGITSAGPGDVIWAFEWDFPLYAGKSYIISKDKLITPEPGTLTLLGLGGGALLLRRRRR